MLSKNMKRNILTKYINNTAEIYLFLICIEIFNAQVIVFLIIILFIIIIKKVFYGKDSIILDQKKSCAVFLIYLLV